jgi:hypothetical protein
VIDESLDQPVNWDLLAPDLGSDTLSERAVQTATYCYRVALVVRKDFGRGEYMDVSIVPHEIAEHYWCSVKRVEPDRGCGLADIVRWEIRASRPLVVYFNDILRVRIVRTGHAAVVDGIAEDNGRLFVHINFGWGGASDGWYDFEEIAAERQLLYAFRVVPQETR